jgi:alditol oxidase
VRGGDELHAGGDLARGADRDGRDVQHQAVVVEEGPRPDADLVPVLEVERRPDVHALAAFREQLAQQRVAQLLLGEGAAVVALEDLLRALEVGGEILVLGDVQIAAQHPLLHLPHVTPPSQPRQVRMHGDRPGTNWAGSLTYRADRLHRPSSVDQLREIVAAAPQMSVLGSRHAFNGIGDAAELVTLDDLPPGIVVDRAAQTVSCSAAVRYGALAEALNAEGFALRNLASLPHISIGGAIATATHGSGDANGNLATAVAALDLLTSHGELVTFARGDEDFEGVVVSLGALGVVTRVTLDVEPAYQVRQRVFEDLPWEALFDHFDEIAASGYSVSVITRLEDNTAGNVWVRTRVTDQPEEPRGELFGARPAAQERHPIPGNDPVHCTPQLGRPGLWSDRLPTFRMGFTPSNGEEIQSEFLIPRGNAVAALEAVRSQAGSIRPVLQVCELRTITGDRLWLSPEYGTDTIGIHFTWKRDQAAVERALVELEAALEPLGARPHWGKLFVAEAGRVAELYERLPDFARLADALDPRRAFRSPWLERHVFGAT